MAKVTMLNMAGAEAGSIELKDDIFGIEVNQYAVHEVVKNYLANQRQGTQSAKNRGEVRGGGKKPFRQKGTGRHRQGSSTDPSQVGVVLVKVIEDRNLMLVKGAVPGGKGGLLRIQYAVKGQDK